LSLTVNQDDGRAKDSWAIGSAYEPYVGRWSRLVAAEFLSWLAAPPGSRWLDVGCGTGVVSQTILQTADPGGVTGIDRSPDYVAFAQAQVADERADFKVGDAQQLPVETAVYDVVVSGLLLNFVAQPDQGAAEMARAVRNGGTVAAYVWDYAGKMQLMRHFWNAAAALDSSAYQLDEGRRFPLCQPEPLAKLFQKAGLNGVEVRPIDISTDFKEFDDFWSPFLGGQGPAPTYAMSLSDEGRRALRERLRASLPLALDGSIPLVARAWAVRGVR
jgi:ubiquinone/menaquinone biosynthesis C-methylase UbiE